MLPLAPRPSEARASSPHPDRRVAIDRQTGCDPQPLVREAVRTRARGTHNNPLWRPIAPPRPRSTFGLRSRLPDRAAGSIRGADSVATWRARRHRSHAGGVVDGERQQERLDVSPRPGITFQDGSPLDAEAARTCWSASSSLGLAPSTVLAQFIDDPARIIAPDSRTLVFNLGNHDHFRGGDRRADGGSDRQRCRVTGAGVGGDWGHDWAQTHSDGIGTGPYRVTSFDVEEGVVLERYPEYWRGWADTHFDGVTIRVVTEPETRLALIQHGGADRNDLPLATVNELEANRDLRVDRRFTLAVSYVAMTVAGPLRSSAVRQALCWAFPYDEVVDGLRGIREAGSRPGGRPLPGFNADTFVYSPISTARERCSIARVSRRARRSHTPCPRVTARRPRSPSFFRLTSRRSDDSSTSRSLISRRTSTSPSGTNPRRSAPISCRSTGRRTATIPGCGSGPGLRARPGKRATSDNTATHAWKTCWRRRSRR